MFYRQIQNLLSCSVCVLQTDSDAADSADHATHAGERAVQEPESRPAEADCHAVTAETGPPTRHDAPHAVPLQTLPQVRRQELFTCVRVTF